jgi:hypothetical protein
LRYLFIQARARSKSKQLPFDLTEDYINYLWESQQGRCSLTNREFDLGPTERKYIPLPNTVSLDRIIPELGYTIGNVRLVVYHVNIALSDFGTDALKQLANDILSKGS